jgi:hypothetical protein
MLKANVGLGRCRIIQLAANAVAREICVLVHNDLNTDFGL